MTIIPPFTTATTAPTTPDISTTDMTTSTTLDVTSLSTAPTIPVVTAPPAGTTAPDVSTPASTTNAPGVTSPGSATTAAADTSPASVITAPVDTTPALATTAPNATTAASATTAAGGMTTASATTAAGGMTTASATTAAGGMTTASATTAAGGMTTASATIAAGGMTTASATTAAGGMTTASATTAAGGMTTASATTAAGGTTAASATTAAGGMTTASATTAAGGMTTASTTTAAGGTTAASTTTAAGGTTSASTTAAAGGTIAASTTAAAGATNAASTTIAAGNTTSASTTIAAGATNAASTTIAAGATNPASATSTPNVTTTAASTTTTTTAAADTTLIVVTTPPDVTTQALATPGNTTNGNATTPPETTTEPSIVGTTGSNAVLTTEFTTAPENTTILSTAPEVPTILTSPEATTIPNTVSTTIPETTAAAGDAITTPWRPTTADKTTTETTEITTFGETTMLPSTYPEQTCPPDISIRNVTLWSVCTSRYFRFNATENTVGQLVGRIEGSTPSGVQLVTSNFTISDDNDASVFFVLTNCSNSSCDIVTAQRLDRESKATFFFEVLWLREVYFIGTRVTVQDCSSIPVEINIDDLNDNPPSFNHGVIAPYVLDQSPAGSIVAVLSASDADTGPNAVVTYSITPPTYADYFAVDSDGIVTARLPVGQDELRQSGLLADEATELLFEVVASDGRFDTNINVSFDVLTVQTGGPAINRSLPIEVTALEEQPPGTHVVNLRTERPSDSDSMVYSFGNTVSSFSLDSTTGEITTAEPLDRETKDSHYIVVSASDPESGIFSSVVAEITVAVEDINDKSPVLSQTEYQGRVPEHADEGQLVILNGSQLNISIAEDIGRGFSVATITAADADSGSNGRIFYTINSGGDGKFTISPTSGVLSLASELDREVKSMYRISISASDGGSPSLTSEDAFLVHVTVLDVNDNEPEFLQNIYYVTIDEQSDIVTNVANITALDADEGSNAEVRYTMFNCAPQFSIDYTTGSMYVQSRLDYENTTFSRSYSCNINATDGNYTSTALVQVEVRDINDNTPEFGTEDGYSTQLLFNENQVFPAIVAAVDATDKDSGSNGDISFSIYNSSCSENVTANFTIDESTGIIRLHGIIVLGQPFPSWCNMTVVATDRGVPSLSSSTTVSVGISKPTDVTSKVTFDDTAFSGFVVENDDTVQHIVKVNAVAVGTHDCEAILRYEFASWQTEDFEFTIDSTTGNVSSRSVSFDRELKATYAFAVIAANNCSGESKRFDYTSVIVHVNDMNDEQPTFSRPEYRMQVEEGMSGLVVGRVTAEDRDEGPNGVITYTINGEGDEYFDIDGNGAMMTKVALDRENITQYQISVMAEDRGQPAQNSTSVVIIDVLDVNDNAPRFDESLYAVTLPEDLARFSPVSVDVSSTNLYPPEFRDVPPSHQMFEDDGRRPWQSKRVIEVRASDNDTDSEGEVQFSLAEGISEDLFRLSASPTIGDQDFFRAEIWTKSQLDREKHPEGIILQVLAVDQGVTPKTSTATVHITLKDLNDNPPELHLPEDDVIISQSSDVGTLVLQVNVTDPDQEGQLHYQIQDNSDDTLVMDSTTGDIYLQKKINESLQDITNFVIVEVQDWDPEIEDQRGTEKNVGGLTIIFRYDNPNEHPPMFEPNDYKTVLDDFLPVGSNLTNLNISACDMDCPESCETVGPVTNCSKEGTIVYSIKENVRDIFSINEMTGVITTTWPFDKATENYTLIIAATDQADIPRSGTATVRVFVTESLENPTDGPSQPSPGMCTDGITDTQLQAENEQLSYILYGVGAVAGLLALITGGVTTKLIFSLRRMKNMSIAHLTTPAFRDPGSYEYLSAKTDYAYAEGKGDDDDDSQPPALPPTHTRPSLDSRRPSNIPRLSRAGIGYYTPPMEMTSFAGSSRGTREQLRNSDGDDLSIRDGGYLTMEASMPDYANQHHDPYLRAQDDTSREIRYGYLPLNTSEREEQRPHSEYYNGHNRPGDTRYGYQNRQSRTPVEDSSEQDKPGDKRYGHQSRQSRTPVKDSSEHNRPGDTRYGYQSRQSRTMEDSSEHNRPDYVRSRHQSHQPMEPEMSNSQQQDRNNQHASPDRSDKRRYSHQDTSRPQGDHSTPWQYVSPHALQTRNNNQTRHQPSHEGPREDGHSRGFSYTTNVQPSPSPGKDKAPGHPHRKPRRKKSGNSTDPLLSPHNGVSSGNQLEDGEVDLWGQFS
uniref:Cadherin domain-containing protein n=1 Tax=Branchiostoma floridae TaxID=7739 RepID=C3XZ70_BRAFL|eukprot:XP_002610624.1 hypothetical protein BRAFLDRAFT_65814 [Branchiostoma floridae]